MSNNATETPTERNELGEIATNYQKLHNISEICQAKQYANLTKGSYNTSVQSIFLIAEVALLNLIRLTNKASCKLAQNDLNGAYVYTRWIRGFHLLMRSIGLAASELQQNSYAEPTENEQTTVSITQSSTLTQYLEAHRKHEQLFEDILLHKDLATIKIAMSNKSHDSVHYSLIHNMRLNAHDSTKWESDLCDVIVDPGMPAYPIMVGQDHICDAVNSATLEKDSYYTEFVALHQIPELVCMQVNDHTEQAIRALRENKLSEANEQLIICNVFMPTMIKSQSVMVDCLATSEYHYLRENLGSASGIHSLAIRQHMFRDLFKSLWNELETWISQCPVNITKNRHVDADTWLKHNVLNNALALHNFHQEWRHEHLHMPRNCLGAGGTKSMIGAPDGLDIVLKMREASNALPALKKLYGFRNAKLSNKKTSAPLSKHHGNKNSLDSKIILLTGKITRDNFPEVQNKEFCPFKSEHPVRKP